MCQLELLETELSDFKEEENVSILEDLFLLSKLILCLYLMKSNFLLIDNDKLISYIYKN